VEERQLDRVADRLDLAAEAADVGVGDVGDLFEHELLDLRLREALEDVAGLRIHEQVVAGAQVLRHQRVGERHDAFLVGVPHDDRAVRVEDLLELDDLAGYLELTCGDDVHRLVEHDFLAFDEALRIDLGMRGDAKLATAGRDVDGTVLVGRQIGAEARRRRRKLLDLFLERDDLLARFTERGGETVVLGQRLRELRTRLGELVLEDLDLTRRVAEATAQQRRLLLEELQLCLKFVHLTLEVAPFRLVSGTRHPTPPWYFPRSKSPRSTSGLSHPSSYLEWVIVRVRPPY
jgi:hypothetical protein